ncbi:MAG: hypothetical protein J0H82_02970 [Alphaproteobacteria bacterium]|jgi:hypothetical protein|nr:hypothetical protein [Alphaproteobacteria bacterium]
MNSAPRLTLQRQILLTLLLVGAAIVPVLLGGLIPPADARRVAVWAPGEDVLAVLARLDPAADVRVVAEGATASLFVLASADQPLPVLLGRAGLHFQFDPRLIDACRPRPSRG